MAVLLVHDRQVDPTFQAASGGGDSFANDGTTELLIYNAGLVAITVTAVAARRCSHGFLDNWAKTVQPGTVMRFGPFLASQFNNASGFAAFTYSAVTDVSVAAQRQK